MNDKHVPFLPSSTGIDTYGTGRSPFFLEPSVIIIITDGGKLSSQQGVLDDVRTFFGREGGMGYIATWC